MEDLISHQTPIGGQSPVQLHELVADNRGKDLKLGSQEVIGVVAVLLP